MHEDVSIIVYEIRRLAREFPGEPVPAEIVPTVAGFSDVDVSKAALLRLSAPQRRSLALVARGFDEGQIARLMATSPNQTRARLRSAAADLGLSPRLARAFGREPVAARPS